LAKLAEIKMDVKVRFKMLVVNNLPLSNTPHDSCFTVTFCERLALPSLLPSPPVLVFVEVKRVAGGYTSHVDVLVIREILDVVGWVTQDVDVFAVDILIRCYVTVFGNFVSVPPDTVVAISICDSRNVID
jgi:hypothetical protein